MAIAFSRTRGTAMALRCAQLLLLSLACPAFAAAPAVTRLGLRRASIWMASNTQTDVAQASTIGSSATAPTSAPPNAPI